MLKLWVDNTADLAVPILFCLGNHDDFDVFSSVFFDCFGQLLNRSSIASATCPDKEAGLTYCIDFQVSKLIVLDTSVKGAAWGKISRNGLDWLEKILSSSATDKNILALHHPPVSSSSQVMDNISLINPVELEELVLRYGNIQLIVCGHVHRSIFTSFARTRIAFCPSVVFQYPIFMARGNR